MSWKAAGSSNGKSSSAGSSAFTVASVPTAMKAGVGLLPDGAVTTTTDLNGDWTSSLSNVELQLSNPAARFTVFFSHGNAEDVGDDLPYLEEMRAAARDGHVSIRTPYEVREIHGAGGCVARVTLVHNETNETEPMDVEAVIALLGFKPDLGPIGNWGLELERNTIKVSQLMETNLPGVYAAGDVARVDGGLDLSRVRGERPIQGRARGDAPCAHRSVAGESQ